MSEKLADHYSDYKWIKVKRFSHDPAKTAEENYAALDRHHGIETNFLIAEVRKLAAIIDELNQEK